MHELPSLLMQSLMTVNAAHPFARKRLIAPDLNYGRESFATLARRTGGWIGWEVATARTIADQLAFVSLAERGLRVANDVQIASLIAQAFDDVAHSGNMSVRFIGLGGKLGFRTAVRDAILELRSAGVSGETLDNTAPKSTPAAELAPVLAQYEQLLAAAMLVDTAGLFHWATTAFVDEAAFVLDGVTLVVPTLSTRGLPGTLVNQIVAHGATVLAADAVDGLPTSMTHAQKQGEPSRTLLALALRPVQSEELSNAAPPHPELDLFSAATPSDELREVCRRVIGEGLRWDDVEIVATDPDTYGIALDALCQQLQIGASMLHGIPLSRSRIGRAVERWFAWLGSGLSADYLRTALEAMELQSPAADVTQTALARELRALRIGWGRTRYERALQQLRAHAPAAIIVLDDDATLSEVDAQIARSHAVRAVLATLLDALLSITPQVPENEHDDAPPTTAAALAQCTLGYLALMPDVAEDERATLDRLTVRLNELSAADDPQTDFASALAALRDGMSDLRAWPAICGLHTPRRATGGRIHLTDTAHAGVAGRARTFVVGLDAERVASATQQDALLPDVLRKALAPGVLQMVAERRASSTAALVSALASLRGRMTLSYAMRGTTEQRDAGPAPLLLQVFRTMNGDASSTYQQLRAALAPVACAVPTVANEAGLVRQHLLDARDAWFAAIADGPLLRDATVTVSNAFPQLEQGRQAAIAAGENAPSAYHGFVPSAAQFLDPLRRDAQPVSASSMELMSKCGLAWFYRYGLELRTPDDPQFDPESWLDHSQRGSLLHRVFEEFVTAHQGKQESIIEPQALDAVRAIARRAIGVWRERVPPPGEAAFAIESAEIMRAAEAFLAMERDAIAAGDGASWLRTELSLSTAHASVAYRLSDGSMLPIAGRVDRVDALRNGSLRVIDYKSGSATRFRASGESAFGGGRFLQPALYAESVASLLRQPVSSFEFRFPTERGQHSSIGYSDAELAASRVHISALVGSVQRGAFLPTTDPNDCTYCEFAAICRVRVGKYRVDSPRAEWAAANASAIAEYAPMLARRGDSTTDGIDE